MDKTYTDRKSRLGYRWIKSDQGNSYLCPAGTDLGDNPSEEELCRECMDESLNPQND